MACSSHSEHVHKMNVLLMWPSSECGSHSEYGQGYLCTKGGHSKYVHEMNVFESCVNPNMA